MIPYEALVTALAAWRENQNLLSIHGADYLGPATPFPAYRVAHPQGLAASPAPAKEPAMADDSTPQPSAEASPPEPAELESESATEATEDDDYAAFERSLESEEEVAEESIASEFAVAPPVSEPLPEEGHEPEIAASKKTRRREVDTRNTIVTTSNFTEEEQEEENVIVASDLGNNHDYQDVD